MKHSDPPFLRLFPYSSIYTHFKLCANCGVLWLGSSTTQFWTRLNDNNGKINFLTGGGTIGQNNVASGLASASDGEWHNVVSVRSGPTLYLYLDGRLLGSTTGSVRDVSINQNLIIGGQLVNGNFSNAVDGNLDDIRFYNRSLSAAEVQALYTIDDNLNKGLVAHYPFNGNANDESGNGNDGAPVGAVLSVDRFGVADSAFSFDGINDYIEVGDKDSLSFINNVFTFSVWVKANSVDSHIAVLGKRKWPWEYSISSTDTIGRLDFAGWISNGSSKYQNFAQYTTNWDHYLWTADGTQSSLYINGEFISSVPTRSVLSMSNRGNPFRIGEGGSGSGVRYMDGQIDDLRIYNRPLSQSEIQALYTVDNDLSNGLVAHYPFNGNANDESGNGNNGTSNGATLTIDRFGASDSAYQFNALGSHILIPDSASLDIGLNDYTIAAWIQTTNGGNGGRIFSKGSSSCSTGYMMRLSGTKAHLENASNSTCKTTLNSNSDVTDGQWHFLVGVVDRDLDSRFYIDGKIDSVQSINTAAFDFSNARDAMIGLNDVNRSIESFLGNIDDVSIYNRVLTESEIQALYYVASPTPQNQPPTVTSLPAQKIVKPGTLIDITLLDYVTDPDGDTLTFTTADIPNLPQAGNPTFNSSTGQFTWTPETVGHWPVNVEVSDGNGGNITIILNLVVQDLTACDGSGCTITPTLPQGTYSGGSNLPPGWSIDAGTGKITIPPGAVPGVYTITILVSDGNGGSQAVEVDINVTNDSPSLSLPVANITIDGDSTDWSNIFALVEDTNDLGDDVSVAGSDVEIVKLAVSSDRSKLYFMIQLTNGVNPENWYRLFLKDALDSAGGLNDRQIDFEFRNNAWDVVSQDLSSNQNWDLADNGVGATGVNFLEGSVDIALLGIPEQFKLTGRSQSGVNPYPQFDHFGLTGMTITPYQTYPSNKIVVDGDSSDWAGITPFFVDAQGDSICGSDADFKAIYTTIDETYAYVMVEAYGNPIFDGLEINFDYKPGQQIAHDPTQDLHTNISSSNISASLANLVDFPLTDASSARGAVMEARILLSDLENATYFHPTFANIWDRAYQIESNGCDPSSIPSPFGGSISGTVTDVATGLPIEGVYVGVQNSNNWTQTGADGTYLLKVSENQVLLQTFSQTDYMPQIYPGVYETNVAEPVVVSGSDITGIDFSLEKGSLLQGAISLDGSPIQDANVRLYSVTEGRWLVYTPFVGKIYDSTNGLWSLAVPPGTYKILASTGTSATPMRYYGDTYVFANAQEITASGTETLAGLDISFLSGNGTLSGNLTYSGQVSGNVIGWTSPQSGNDFPEISGAAMVTSLGNFSMTPPPGDWYVKAFLDTNDNFQFDQGEPFGEYPNGPVTLLPGGNVPNLDFSLNILVNTQPLAYLSTFPKGTGWVQWDVASGGNGHVYKKVETLLSWYDAKAEAELMGGHLATITSAAENTWVFDNAGGLNYWLGGTDDLVEGTWQWVTGEPWDYNSWRQGEPNNDGGLGHYLHYYASLYQWNDIPNVYPSATGYIAESEGSVIALYENEQSDIVLSGYDADGDTLTYSITANPVNGALSGTAPNLIYTPASNWSGTDSFTFVANDGTMDSDPVTVPIIVTPLPKPIASITSITPNPANTGEMVEFTGTGGPVDQTITAYSWTANPVINGIELTNTLTLGSLSQIAVNTLPVGVFNIYFSVQNSHGVWSDPGTQQITVTDNTYPDLQIGRKDIKLFDDSGEPVFNPQAGTTVTVEVTVHNIGSIDSSEQISVDFFNGPAEGQPAMETTLPAIAAGESGVANFSWDVGIEECKFITIRTDYVSNKGLANESKTTPEMSYQNNITNRIVMVGNPTTCAGDMTVMLNVPDGNLYAGYPLTVSGKAVYGGNIPVMGAEVMLTINGRSFTTHTVSPNGNYARQIILPSPASDYTLTVTVDDGNLLGTTSQVLTVTNSPDPLPDLTAMDHMSRCSVGFSGTDVYRAGHNVYSVTGSGITLSSTVWNQGALATTGSFNASFYNGKPAVDASNLIETVSVTSGIPARSYKQIKTTGLWAPGVTGFNTVYVVLDNGDTVQEINEFNNQCGNRIEIRERAGDLRPYSYIDANRTQSGLSFSMEPVIGETVTLSTEIFNPSKGDLNNASFAVDYYDGDPAKGGILIGIENIAGSIAAGRKLTSTFNWDTTGVTSGYHPVYVQVDSTNSVVEDFETNNVTSSTVDIFTTGENLWPAGIAFSNYAPRVDSVITVYGSTKNRGGSTSTDTPVRFYRGDPDQGGTLIGAATSTGAVQRGETVSVSTVWTTPSSGGWVTLFAVVNGHKTSRSIYVYNNATPPPPNLQVFSSDILFSPLTPCIGEPAQLSARVRNIGTTTAVGATVNFYAGTEFSTSLVASVPLSDLSGGAETTVSATSDYQIADALTKIRVEIVPGATGDANSNDNQATTSIKDCSPVTAPVLQHQFGEAGKALLLNAAGGLGNIIGYKWELIRKPLNSVNAMLITPSSPLTPFIPDVYGRYEIGLTVTDGVATDFSSFIVDIYQLAYSPPQSDGFTNGSVIATILLDPPIKVTSQGGSTHEFTENASWTFDITDENGNITTKVATVDWIDTLPPTVNVGSDLIADSSICINASVFDNDNSLTYEWTKVSGPGTVTFETDTSEDPCVTASADGQYKLQLSSTDSAGNSGSDTLLLNWDTQSDLTVGVTPPGALTDRAEWSADGGVTWHNPAEVLSMPNAPYTIIFSDLTDWIKPPALTGDIKAGDPSINRKGAYKPIEPVISSITPNPANLGEMITFTATGGPSNTNDNAYQWSASKLVNDLYRREVIIGTDSQIAMNDLSAGTYRIFLSKENRYGDWSDSAFEDITIIDPQAADITIGRGDIRILNAAGEEIKNPVPGQEVTVEVTAHNVGNIATEGEVTVSLYDGSVGTNIIDTVKTVQNLKIHGQATVSFPWTVEPEGCRLLSANASYTEGQGIPTYTDKNSQNNTMTSVVIIGNPTQCNAGITVTGKPASGTLYAGYRATLFGDAVYSWATQYQVMGAEVTIELYSNTSEQVGHTSTRTTSPNGRYASGITLPSIAGEYTAVITVTDGTVQGMIQVPLTVVAPPAPLPDLAPYNFYNSSCQISFSGSDVYSSDRRLYAVTDSALTINATIRNLGNAGVVDASTVSFFNGVPSAANLIGTAIINNLASKQAAHVTMPWTPTGTGIQTIYVQADSEDLIEESNELNNQCGRSIEVRVRKPDTQPYSSNTYQTKTGLNFSHEPVQGEDVTITTDIYNPSKDDILAGETIEVALYNGNPNQGGAYITTARVAGPLPKGGKTTASVIWSTANTAPGYHTLYAVTDPNDIIDEDFETNNTTSRRIDIFSQTANVQPTGLVFSSNYPAIESTIMIKGTVKNRGGQLSESVRVDYYLGAALPENYLEPLYTGNLSRGESKTLGLQWTPQTAGRKTITMVVNGTYGSNLRLDFTFLG